MCKFYCNLFLCIYTEHSILLLSVGRIFKKSFSQDKNRHVDERQKVNWNIINEVRLIDKNGTMVGIVPTSEALQMARDDGLELINISPNVTPPVCKICDYGKYLYTQQKKQKSNKSKPKIKEIQFSPRIGDNDLNIKLKKAVDFLEDNNTVQLVMQLKRQDMQRIDSAMELMQDICQRLKQHAKQVEEPKITGRKIISTCR